ncbi:hypothetical protein [Streptomyces sp. NPDC060198]|uniref:hypothetical protein n=1 Tax=Streptomyces sp. NPDC060198 TaxID=3347070 RepID=UPI00364A4D4D
MTYMTGPTMFVNKYRCAAAAKDEIHVLDSTELSNGAGARRNCWGGPSGPSPVR